MLQIEWERKNYFLKWNVLKNKEQGMVHEQKDQTYLMCASMGSEKTFSAPLFKTL